jgi:tetratricopeptide (TPR) repeat protein
VLKAIGRILLLGKKPDEALRAFERVLQFAPESAINESDVGLTYLESGDLEQAARHLERALALDPLLLDAATPLREVYLRRGEKEKAAALSGLSPRFRQ